MAKGNEYEWAFARMLSKWLTAGQDSKQLIRSVQSGGWSGKTVPQVGDLAPNGAQGEAFRRVFGVEVKAYGRDPEWWHHFTSQKPLVFEWFDHAQEECDPYELIPLLIMSRAYRPNVIAFPAHLESKPFEEDWKRTMVLGREEGQSIRVVRLNDFLSVPFDTYVDTWT